MTPATTKPTETRLSLLEEWKDSLDHELFGNGQPGRFATLERKLDRLTIIVTGLAGASGFGAAIVLATGRGGSQDRRRSDWQRVRSKLLDDPDQLLVRPSRSPLSEAEHL